MKRIVSALFILSLYVLPAQAQVDTTNGITAPSKESNDYRELADYLCRDVTGDRQKANMIYNWITHNIALDVKETKNPEREIQEPNKILKDKKTTPDGYATLFVEMCRAEGMLATTITGYVKDWKFDDGDEFLIPNHIWCAVVINGVWELVDPAMGAGGVSYAPGWFRKQLNKLSKEKVYYSDKGEFEFSYDTSYFLPDPMKFRLHHLPADPVWQLMYTPVPLYAFESSEQSVITYNKQDKLRVKNSPAMERMGKVEEDQRILDRADKMHEFNEQYIAILARKKRLEAMNSIDKILKGYHGEAENEKLTLIQARNKLKDAKELLEQQSDSLGPHYNELKKKNTLKNREAKDHFREVRLNNKLLMSLVRSRASKAQRKTSSLGDKKAKAEEYRKDIEPEHIYEIETIRNEKPSGSTELYVLADSIDIRQNKVKELNIEVAARMQQIGLLQNESEQLWEGIAHYMDLADTVMEIETNLRKRLKDNYDAPVKACMAKINEYRKEYADTLMRQYADNFDTLTGYYEDLQRVFFDEIRLFKSTMRYLEQYRRLNSKEEFILNEYTNVALSYNECIDNYINTLAAYNKYLTAHDSLFTAMETRYNDELELLERMEEGEDVRKKFEDKDLEEDEHFEERTIAGNIESIDKQITLIDEALEELDNPKRRKK